MPVRVMVGLVMLAGTLGVMVTLVDSAWSMVMERVHDALAQGR
jgi:flagellar biosynthesis protein FliR